VTAAPATPAPAARNSRRFIIITTILAIRRPPPHDVPASACPHATGHVTGRVRDSDHAVDLLVDGLVTGASALAGAQLISRRASPTVAGLSIAGLVAAAVGVATW
jgi:hypothetical protein